MFILDVFEMNELVIKSLMSDTYITIKKAVSHLHYSMALSLKGSNQ